MMIPKRVLLNIKNRLAVMSDKQLQEALKFRKSELEQIKKTQSAEVVEYLSFPVEQKISLIESEIKHREKLNSRQL